MRARECAAWNGMIIDCWRPPLSTRGTAGNTEWLLIVGVPRSVREEPRGTPERAGAFRVWQSGTTSQTRATLAPPLARRRRLWAAAAELGCFYCHVHCCNWQWKTPISTKMIVLQSLPLNQCKNYLPCNASLQCIRSEWFSVALC